MKEKGISTLVLVFIIAAILAMIIFVLYPISLLGARRASQIRYSQTAFFATEGAIYETIQHLKDDPDWPNSFPYSDPSPYQLGDALIKREIRKDEISKTITIDITATVKKAKRRLVINLSYISLSEEKVPLDVCITIDKSYSMDDFGTSPEEPFKLAKDIAKKIVNALNYTGDENTTDKAAIVSFGEDVGEGLCGTALPDVDLYLHSPPGQSQNQAAILGIIDGIGFPTCPGGVTKSITKAIVGCRCPVFGHHHNSDCITPIPPARSDAQQVIIVISDGHTNAAWPYLPECSRYSCYSNSANYCEDGKYDPGSVPCQPDDGAGNLCTHSAINEENYFSNAHNYKYVSLYIPNLPTTQSDCGTPGQSKKLAKKMMQAIASNDTFPFFQEIKNYPDLDSFNVDTLHDLLTAKEGEDGERIITSVFGLQEELPEPD